MGYRESGITPRDGQGGPGYAAPAAGGAPVRGETAAADAREKLSLVVTGHVDHGKSTVIGRLLYDTGSLPQGAVDRVREISRETGQPFEFAFLLDAFEEERSQGITIDTTRLQFRTEKRDYLIIDAPGHKEFLKNMISGASDAEAAFLVVDASRGVEEQSRRHAHMLSLLGVGRVGVLVNKMDLAGWSERAFLGVKEELSAYLWNLGLEAGPFLPLSAILGENFLSPSPFMPWFGGPTLAAALDALEKPPREEGLRLPIQDVYKFDGRRIVAGRVESGRLAAGDELLISPGARRTRCATVESWPADPNRASASAGESAGITLADEFFNRRGEVISLPDDPPEAADSFKASVFWMGREPMAKGRRYRLKLATDSCGCVVTGIYGLIDSDTLAPAAASGGARAGEVCEAAFLLERAVAMDLFARHRATGRFVLVDGYDVAGGGIVTGLGSAKDVCSGFAAGGAHARAAVFDEYSYSLEDQRVEISEPAPRLWGAGDEVPLAGGSFSYPPSFDVVAFRDRAAVKIRDGRVAEVLPLSGYSWEGFPAVNGRGFGLKVGSAAEWAELLDAFTRGASGAGSDPAARWLDFNAYRRIALTGPLAGPGGEGVPAPPAGAGSGTGRDPEGSL
ncbi:MAG: sulfate adenylyltransferase [Deltaproteobacteria bacterium]|jgi:bifunctional enzyme CysN/CysC/sulfate adenylyltransferase subunit 1|nr:sulfate adenylyltransferase [Deltaproteobacteria bacterium]